MKTILIACAAAAVLSVAPVARAEQLSTPAEQAQTRALNQAGDSGTYTSPRVLNGEQTNDEQSTGAQASGANGSGDQDADGAPDGRARAALNPDDFVALRTADPDRLDSLPVEVADGHTIGRVINVRMAEDGTPSAVQIALPDRSHVWVGAEELRYNPSANLLLTNANVDELRNRASGSQDAD